MSWLAKWIKFSCLLYGSSGPFWIFDVYTNQRLEFDTVSDNVMLNGQPIAREIVKVARL